MLHFNIMSYLEGNDFLLKRNKLDFSIDSIWLEDKEDNIFSVRILPDINTKTFYPFHCRTIRAKPELLEKYFYYDIRKNYSNLPVDEEIEFSSSLVQGGYYSIPIQYVPRNIFKSEIIFSKKNDIFKDYLIESPYKFKNDGRKKLIPSNQARRILEKKGGKDGVLYLYGLKVGQGDTLLVICPNKSAYIIDINIYKGNWISRIDTIKCILHRHGLNERNVKGLIITHKHLDHIRGIVEIINTFDIENFFINHSYIHDTKAVHVLLNECLNIKNWINCNGPLDYYEGGVHFCFIHPTISANNKKSLPNINDSSICICLKFISNVILLTGDASHHIINNRLTCNYSKNDVILKVSHHGSITGTDGKLCSRLHPKYSFISAGNNAKFKHPHPNTINELNRLPNNEIHITNKIKGNVEYKIDKTGIYSYVI